MWLGYLYVREKSATYIKAILHAARAARITRNPISPRYNPILPSLSQIPVTSKKPKLSTFMSPQRTVLITGCSDDGIGSALALSFSKRNFRVYATARNVSNMKDLQNVENVTLLRLDILNVDQIKEVADLVSKETGGTLDYFVNNAGSNRFMPLLDEDMAAAKKLFDTNFWAALRLVQEFSPLLIESKGTIVLNTSVSGYLNVPWQGTISLSQFLQISRS